jgi:hypothetical protein
MVVGFLLARTLPVAATIALGLAFEVLVGFTFAIISPLISSC